MGKTALAIISAIIPKNFDYIRYNVELYGNDGGFNFQNIQNITTLRFYLTRYKDYGIIIMRGDEKMRVGGVRNWNCKDCGWTTSDNTVMVCEHCSQNMLIIPLKMDNALFLAIDCVVVNFFNLDFALNSDESGVELIDYLIDSKVATIRNWNDFRKFFGDSLYRQFVVVDRELELDEIAEEHAYRMRIGDIETELE